MLFELKQLAKAALDLFFPRQCVGCGRVGDFLCPECCRRLPYLLPPLCQKCGRAESTGLMCPHCWGWESYVDGIRSPYRFDGVARDVIHAFKYHNHRALCQCLASLMADYFEQSKIPGEVLVPVPLHYRRLRERGYNQSGLLAHELGKRLGIPVAENVLHRMKDTSPQVRALSVEARRQNVEGAFVCKRTEEVKEKGVIVVDDVCTSGATLDACARALKVAGAKSVWGLTFARECE